MSWDPIWQDVYENSEWGRHPSEHLVRFMARSFRDRDQQAIRVLELGCGPGANVLWLSREGFETSGIDGSSVAIERCRHRLEKESLSAHLVVGDIVELPFPDEHFDAVVDVECLYANARADTAKALAQVFRVLRPGGLLFSQSFSDRMALGTGYRVIERGGYSDVVEGPFAGKGFVRLVSRSDVDELYGEYLELVSVDHAEYSFGGGSGCIAEWLIVAGKRGRDA